MWSGEGDALTKGRGVKSKGLVEWGWANYTGESCKVANLCIQCIEHKSIVCLHICIVKSRVYTIQYMYCILLLISKVFSK